MTLRPPAFAEIGVRADEHPPARIIGDHLVQIAVAGPAKVAVMRGFRGVERVVVEIEADHLGPGRHGIDLHYQWE